MSYTGNAGLGFGSNPNLPASASPNTFDVLTETSRDISQRAQNQNAILFQQKIRDRDNMLNMLATDQIQTGDILPEYRKEVQDAVTQMTNQFRTWKGNPNDTEGYMKYKQAHQKAADLAKIAQLNTIQIKDNRAVKAQDPVQSHWKDYDEFDKRQLDKGLNGIADPYQKLTYFNPEVLLPDLLQGAFLSTPEGVTKKTTVTDKGGKVTTSQVTTTKPTSAATSANGKQIPVSVGEGGQLSPISKAPDKVFNYDNVLGWAGVRYFQNDVEKQYQDQLLSGMESQPIKRALQNIEAINNRIRTYNQQTQGRATPVRELKENEDYKIIRNPQTGEEQIKIDMDTPEFAAKWALANYKGNYFEKGAAIFNKDVAEYGLKSAESKSKIGALEALRSQRLASAKLFGLKAKEVDQQINPIKMWDELANGNIKNEATSSGTYVPRINAKNMSEGLKNALGISPINSSGDYNVIPTQIYFTSKKDGKKYLINEDDAFRMYDDWRKNDTVAEKLRKEKGGKEPDIFDFLYTRPDVKFKIDVVGTSPIKRSKSGMIIGGGEISRSNAAQAWLNQQMQVGKKGKDIDINEESVTSDITPDEE